MLEIKWETDSKIVPLPQPVTDVVILVCQLLRRDLRELRELVDIMEPVKSWDEG